MNSALTADAATTLAECPRLFSGAGARPPSAGLQQVSYNPVSFCTLLRLRKIVVRLLKMPLHCLSKSAFITPLETLLKRFSFFRGREERGEAAHTDYCEGERETLKVVQVE